MHVCTWTCVHTVANPLPTRGRPFPTCSAAHDQCWPRRPLITQKSSCWQGIGMGTHLYSPAKSSASAAKCGHFSNPTKKPGSSTNARHEEAAIVSIVQRRHPTRHRDCVIQAAHRAVHGRPPPSNRQRWCSQNESIRLLQPTHSTQRDLQPITAS